jgi:hypothetical protein
VGCERARRHRPALIRRLRSNSTPNLAAAEKIDGEFAQSRIWSTPLVAAENAELAAQAEFRWLVADRKRRRTRWRMRQSGANRSPAVRFPDHQGKYREFSRFRPSEAELQPKRSRPLSGFCRNSLLDGTGNYFDGTAIFFEVTGKFNPQNRVSPYERAHWIPTHWIYSP